MTKRAPLDELRDQFLALARRFNEVALLLPRVEDFDDIEEEDVPGLRLVIAEMNRIKAEIDAVLAAARAREISG
jgi:hypothetical protein